MIMQLSDDGELVPTVKAMMVKHFKDAYDYYEKEDVGLGIAFLSILHYMYVFDSPFLWDYEDEEERARHVKRFVSRGSEVRFNRKSRNAFETARLVYDRDISSMYITMRTNLEKLQSYADRLMLYQGNPVEEGTPIDEVPIVVDYKEFTAVNAELPKQQKALEAFERTIKENIKNNIDIYGGGQKGAYE